MAKQESVRLGSFLAERMARGGRAPEPSPAMQRSESSTGESEDQHLPVPPPPKFASAGPQSSVDPEQSQLTAKSWPSARAIGTAFILGTALASVWLIFQARTGLDWHVIGFDQSPAGAVTSDEINLPYITSTPIGPPSRQLPDPPSLGATKQVGGVMLERSPRRMDWQ